MQFDTDITRDGFTLRATIEPDNDHGAPWDEECGHGPVSGAVRHSQRTKKPGELVLSLDSGYFRFYDFAQACKIARRDGWGYAPQPLTVVQNSGGKWHAWFGNGHAPGCNVGGFDSNHEAVNALYTAHRATMTPRAYAAAAALADFERLRAWCNDQWSYVGVIVTASRNGIELGSARLWGIESDASDYLEESADELASQAIAAARLTTATA